MPNTLGFIENAGQLPHPVRYYAILPSGMLYITDRGYGYVRWGESGLAKRGLHVQRIELIAHGTSSAAIEAGELIPTLLNFYHSSTRAEGVRVFRHVRLRALFPGVDAIFRITSTGQIKCDYVLAPETKLQSIRFRIVGAAAAITHNGKLKFRIAFGQLTESAPIGIQGARTIPMRYQLEGNILGFATDAPYDQTQMLTIDPEIEWSSFAGGGLADQIAHVRTDYARNIIVLGRTQSLDFPSKLGFSSTLRGDYDAFISKYSASGALLWATYYGGARREIHNLDHCDLVVDGNGSILIAGCTQSDDLPITAGAFQRAKNSSMPTGYDLFLAQFNASGQLVWSSYCGGNDNEDAYGLSLDRSGNIYMVGHTSSSSFPVSTPQPTVVSQKPTQSQDVFVLKLSPQRQPLWVFFLGGNDLEYATDVVCDYSGSIYVAGYTQSTDFPTVGAQIYQRIKTAKNDGYVFKLDGLGRLQWCTLIGGNGDDYCSSIALDSSFDRRIIVGGTTSSTDMWFRGAGRRTLSGNSDGFIAAFDPRNGDAYWVQYHGGSNTDELTALAIDPDNNIIAVGRTLGDYPTIAAQQSTYNGGGGDMFIAKLSSSGETQWATYAGGTFLDRATDVAIDGNTNFVVVGHSASQDFPIIASPSQPTMGNLPGIDDGVLVKFCNIAIPVATVSARPEYCMGDTRVLSAFNRGSSVQYDSYQWELNGILIPGATDATYQIPTTLDSGTYRFVCRVTNTARCPAVTDTIIVRIHPVPRIAPRQFAICYGDPIRLDSIAIDGKEPFRYQWFGQPPPDDPTAPAPIVHPSQTTTYTLRITDANGCSTEQSFAVLVLPISQVPITIQGDRVFCEGDSTTLVLAANLGAITWNTGEQTPSITVRRRGEYFATIRIPSGCEGYTDTVTITVHPTPQPIVTFDGSQLSTTAEYQRYQWFLDGRPLAGATERTIESPRVGTYWVVVDSLGCTGVSTPIDITLTAHTHITIGSATAAIGKQVRIPIRMTTSQQLDRLGVHRLVLGIGYNATVLELLPTLLQGTERTAHIRHGDGSATVVLSITDLRRDTIAVLDVRALWGNAESSVLAVESVDWGSPLVSTRWTDGVVHVTGFCTAGGTLRLFESTGEFGIRMIVPSPASDYVTVVFEAIEDAMHTLVLSSIDGRSRTVLQEHLSAGSYAVSLDLSTYPPGYYMMELRSATLQSRLPLVIVR